MLAVGETSNVHPDQQTWGVTKSLLRSWKNIYRNHKVNSYICDYISILHGFSYHQDGGGDDDDK